METYTTSPEQHSVFTRLESLVAVAHKLQATTDGIVASVRGENANLHSTREEEVSLSLLSLVGKLEVTLEQTKSGIETLERTLLPSGPAVTGIKGFSHG